MPAQRAPEFEPGAADGGDGPRPVPAAAVSPGLGSDVPVARGRPTRRPWQRVPYFWFILPALLAYGILFVFPTLRAFYVSLFDWSGVGPVGDLIWFDNFADLLRSDRFQRAAWNSTKLFLAIFVFQNTVSLGLAVMLNRRSPMTHVYRAIIFLPVVMSAVATGILWVLMLDPIIGVVNPVLRDVGLANLQREWQADPDWAFKTIVLVQAWQWNGMAVVLYLAGLQNVPEDLGHAALVDGARPWQVFRDVTFPLLAPAFTIVTVLSFILIYRAFDLIYVLAGPDGQPDLATLVVGVLIYTDAFGSTGRGASTRFSYAVAEGVTLFVFLVAVSALLMRFLGRREEAIH